MQRFIDPSHPCHIQSDIDTFAEDELEELQTHNLRRYPTTTSSPPRERITIDGREYLLMCSNNYLGLANDPRLAEAAASAASEWGTSASASRLVSGTTTLHQTLERRLAKLTNRPDCVLFSSGYLANVGTISSLVGMGDWIISDALNHASIIDGCRLSKAGIRTFEHGDAGACEKEVLEARDAGGKILIVTESVFSMNGDMAPLAELASIADTHSAWLLVDEAHSIGLLGKGAGAVAEAQLTDKVDVIIGTAAKALGAAGGFVAASEPVCEFLRNRARTYIFDTAPAPAVVGAAVAALDVIEAEPERAQNTLSLATRLASGLSGAGFNVLEPTGAIVPVILGASDTGLAVSEHLFQQGIFAPVIRPPSVPEGQARIRLCPMATHTEADIDHVVASFQQAQAAVA